MSKMTPTTVPLDATTLRIVAVRDEAQLPDLAPRWNELSEDVPFRAWEWMHTWWRHYRGWGRELFTLLVVDGQDDVVGIAPWYLESSVRRGRVVRFLGSGEVCPDYLTILCPAELRPQVGRRLADWLATEGAAQWHLLDLTGVEEADAAIDCLGRRLAEYAHKVDRQFDLSCWRTALPDDWPQFLATLTKSRRERTRYLLRRAMDSGRGVVHRVETEDDLARGFDVLVDLHQKRRRSLSQAGCFTSRRFTEFHREVAGRFLASGKLRLLWTELDGRPMSADYGFVGGDTVYYYQSGFEPELSSESPGWISLAVSLKLAIEEGYRNFDFLRGDESYKTSWQAAARPLVHVRIVGRRARARARWAASRGCVAAKNWGRQLLSRSKG
jgi:CelD/BcsL family acetyltransferase involved in cellulose biosynthesis